MLQTQGAALIEKALRFALGRAAGSLRDDALYRQRVIDPAWEMMPLPIRLLGRKRLRWDELLLALRDEAFDTAGGTVALRTDCRAAILRVLGRLPGPAEFGPEAQPPPGAARSVSPQPAAAARPERSSVAVGIDLGTTFSAVAYLDAAGRPTTVPNSSGNLITPSVVLFGEDGIVVGEEAVQAAALEPERVAVCAKRDMGAKHYRKAVGGERLPPEVISSYILRKLKADAERRLGPVLHAVITVPAYFDESRRQATVNAGKLAGLSVLDILNEPTAAAIAFGYQEGFLARGGAGTGGKPTRLLVYDLGGGTFDVTVMEISGDHFRAVATDGDVQLGGRDWDEKLVNLVAERFIAQHREDPRWNPESLYDLYRAAEQAKRTLSERDRAILVVSHVGTRFKTTVTREEFEEATRPLLERTRATTEIMLLQSGLSWADIDRLLLVGGSSRMPMVVRMLRELTGKEPDRSVSPDEAVAQGAALYADLIMKKRWLGNGHTSFSVVNVNSHSLGVVGREPATGRRVNSVLIGKNSPLPARVTKRFKTARDGQRSLVVRVVEGESEQPEACTAVGQFVVRDLPPDLPAGWPVEVSYRYEENGCLRVSARLVGHKVKAATEFVRDNSLSEGDLLLWGQRLKADEGRLNL
jgi:molecular chaperone DnaK